MNDRPDSALGLACDRRDSVDYPPGWEVSEHQKQTRRLAGPDTLHLYAVELTNFCNLKCAYCLHPTMRRAKGHMSAEVLDRCIALATLAGQDRLVLHFMGEPLMHPQLEDRLRQVAASGLEIQFSTNGVLLERVLPRLLSIGAHINITLSVHLWVAEPAAAYDQALAAWQQRTRGTNLQINRAFNIDGEGKKHFFKWTNYEYKAWDHRQKCFYLRDNWGVVLWNGDIIPCCLTAEADEKIGNIMEPRAHQLKTRPWKGCGTCRMRLLFEPE